MAQQLAGKVAYVTGAASGIGKAIADLYAQEGAKVVIADMKQEAADAAALDIQSKGGTAMGVAVDVTQEAQVDASVEAAVRAYGGIDILVSNAGIQIVKPVQDFSLGEWQKMLAIQLDGAFLTTRACIKHMYAQGRGGSIIYTGSVHSKEASQLKAPYVTAKHGLEGLAKVVAKEGGPQGVRASTCSWAGQCHLPGLCAHAFSRQANPGAGQGAGNFRRGSDQERDAERDGGWRVHHAGRCGARGAVFCCLPDQCADWPVNGGEPRLVHAVNRQKAGSQQGAERPVFHASMR